MKKIFISTVLFCLTIVAFSQKQDAPLPYNQHRIDSLFRVFPKLHQSFVAPAPKELGIPFINNPREKNKSFEESNPGATVINKTSRGTIYNMPMDNMAVLAPDMNRVENIPGKTLRPSPNQIDRMPNPLKAKNK